MKKIKAHELHQVAGGAVHINGETLKVDTSGIPDYCIGQIEFGFQLLVNQMEMGQNYCSNLEEPFNAAYLMSGCDMYIESYFTRVDGIV